MTALLRADRAVLLVMNHGLRRPWLDHVALLVLTLERWDLVWLALFAAAFLFAGRYGRRIAISGAAALALAWLLDQGVVKGILERPRPFDPTQLGTQAAVLGSRPTTSSFPSGAEAAAVAAACLLSYLGPGWGAIGWILAVLVGFAGPYAGVHFPSDVVGGVAVGLLAAWLALWLLGKPRRRPLPRRRRPRPAGDRRRRAGPAGRAPGPGAATLPPGRPPLRRGPSAGTYRRAEPR